MLKKKRSLNRKYEILNEICKLTEYNGGWSKELNIISWDESEPVFDIRYWNKSHTDYTVGIELTNNEMQALVNVVENIGREADDE